MSWILVLIIYTIIILIYSYWLYKKNYVYYKPFEYTNPDTLEKINVHSLYPEFECIDKLSFIRIFIGNFFFFNNKISNKYIFRNNAKYKIKTSYENIKKSYF